MEKKIGIIGYGKMGQAIQALAPEHKASISYIKKRADTWDLVALKSCDVAIEFSTPDAAAENIAYCLSHGVPVVSGTTGWLGGIKNLSTHFDTTETAFLYGSNFSIGMNLFFKLNQKLATLMHPNWAYDCAIVETHHVHKLDKPSGTAISLAEDILKVQPYEQWTIDGQKEATDLPIYAVREGEVPGRHTIIYENDIDKIKITHDAKSREGFARGAIEAAIWTINKKGFFSISDYVDDVLSKL